MDTKVRLSKDVKFALYLFTTLVQSEDPFLFFTSRALS